MQVQEFARLVPDLASKNHHEVVMHFCWYLQYHQGMSSIGTTDVRQCYDILHMDRPNISDVLARLAAKKPKFLLKTGDKYRMEMRVRNEYDAKYGNRPITISIDEALEKLPGRLTDETKRKYLQEAIQCLRAKCPRAAILMTWCMAYDHLINWILAEPNRLQKFNSKLPNKAPFDTGFVMSCREDFERLGESETIELVL